MTEQLRMGDGTAGRLKRGRRRFRAAEGGNPFTLDSKDPTGDYQAFLQGEVRYASLKKTEPALAEELYKETEEASRERLAGYKKMAGK